MLKSLIVFVLAGLCEIGGGYLVWQWLKEGRSAWLGGLGGVILVFNSINQSTHDHLFSQLAARRAKPRER